MVWALRLPFSQAQRRVGTFCAPRLLFGLARLVLGGFWLDFGFETAFFAGSAAGGCFLCAETAFLAGSAGSWGVLA
ncbi:hypothetical protein BC351_19550 [Paenibacillus ferrarius]|uniref:Uncharacterized protein n=1 Tax=Paenibacillus ferrarius TaxID=1469647 RepID=A0A1V4HP30_9BACL|nr:hypothetical protein BC351_19550 [Paenibacillus ferrarius]